MQRSAPRDWAHQSFGRPDWMLSASITRWSSALGCAGWNAAHGGALGFSRTRLDGVATGARKMESHAAQGWRESTSPVRTEDEPERRGDDSHGDMPRSA